MLNLCEGHVFVELNYPHIIGISGYERHHDVATGSRIFIRGSCPGHAPEACTNRARSRRSNSGQTMAKQGQNTNQGLEGLTVAARDAANVNAAGKRLPPVHLWNP